jgi:hypothetical protein
MLTDLREAVEAIRVARAKLSRAVLEVARSNVDSNCYMHLMHAAQQLTAADLSADKALQIAMIHEAREADERRTMRGHTNG